MLPNRSPPPPHVWLYEVGCRNGYDVGVVLKHEAPHTLSVATRLVRSAADRDPVTLDTIEVPVEAPWAGTQFWRLPAGGALNSYWHHYTYERETCVLIVRHLSQFYGVSIDMESGNPTTSILKLDKPTPWTPKDDKGVYFEACSQLCVEVRTATHEFLGAFVISSGKWSKRKNCDQEL